MSCHVRFYCSFLSCVYWKYISLLIGWLINRGLFTLWLLENLMRYLMLITYKGHKHVETPHLRAYVVDAIPVAYHITVLLFVFLLICLKRQEKHEMSAFFFCHYVFCNL